MISFKSEIYEKTIWPSSNLETHSGWLAGLTIHTQWSKMALQWHQVSNFCNILTFSIWTGWKRWKDLPLKSDHENNTTGKLYITFSLPVVINYAAVHLVIQCIHIFSIQLCVSDTLSLSFFPWFCQGRGDYLKESTYAAWAGFGQQGLRANNPLLSNELWFLFPFLFFQIKKEYVKPLWTRHWSHITATVSLLRNERKSSNS